jgi:signal transduction histidine kinase
MRDGWWRAERTVDWVVTAALGALAVLQTTAEWRGGTAPGRLAVVAGAGLAAAGLLMMRRRVPLIVVLGTAGCAALVTAAAHHPAGGPLAPAVALYSLAAHAGWRPTALTGVAALCVLTVAWLTRGTGLAGPVLEAAALLTIAGFVGLYAGSRAQVSQALAARATQLEREQTLLARQAALHERMWIARELHDTIGHHVSLLVVQAGGVRATLPADHLTRPVLDSMISGGKEAMTEMRRMVDLLRPIADDAPTGTYAAAPGVPDIPALCERLRRSGLPVELDLPVGIDVPRSASVAAYRIVQEALTNVVKHAGLVPTRVRVACQDAMLDLRITNAAGDPRIPPTPSLSGGHGQAGMRERAELFAGRFFAAPVPDGGYGVHATLSLEDRS